MSSLSAPRYTPIAPEPDGEPKEGGDQPELFAIPVHRRLAAIIAENSVHMDRGLAGVVLLGIAILYVLLSVGPLAGLFFYAPLHRLLTPAALEVFRMTLSVTLHASVLATALSIVFGLPTALCLARVPFRGRRLLDALIELPIALPPIVMGVALILVWGRRGIMGQYLAQAGYPLSFTFAAVVAAQFVVSSPFLVRVAKAAIEQVPRSLEEAAWTFGYSRLATYRLVTLPLASRGIMAGILTCWARAMGEFGATIIFAGSFPGRTQTVPLAVFSLMQSDVDTAVGLAIIMLLFSVLAFCVAQWGLLSHSYHEGD